MTCGGVRLQLKLDDANVFTCIGTSGPNTPEFLLPRQEAGGNAAGGNGAGHLAEANLEPKPDPKVVLQAIDLSMKFEEMSNAIKSIAQARNQGGNNTK